MLLPTPRTAPLPRAGVPLVSELNRGDLRGDAPESELEGVAGRLDPLAGEPRAGDLCTFGGFCAGCTPPPCLAARCPFLSLAGSTAAAAATAGSFCHCSCSRHNCN